MQNNTTTKPLPMPQKYKRRLWTDQERAILTKMYADSYTIEIATKLSRPITSIYAQANLMGLKKSPSFLKMELQRQAERLKVVGVNGRFSKGHLPANKGKQMPEAVYEKAKLTMFKKGNQPHNTKYNGHERISKDGYLEIRIELGKYVLKHRHVWEQSKGKIPNGYIIVFKDRNPMNIALDNLELITKKENMLRNTLHRFPTELKSTIRLVNKLKRNIHEKQN